MATSANALGTQASEINFPIQKRKLSSVAGVSVAGVPGASALIAMPFLDQSLASEVGVPGALALIAMPFLD